MYCVSSSPAREQPELLRLELHPVLDSRCFWYAYAPTHLFTPMGLGYSRSPSSPQTFETVCNKVLSELLCNFAVSSFIYK